MTSKNAGKASGASCYVTRFCKPLPAHVHVHVTLEHLVARKIVLIFKCALFYECRHEYSTLSYEFIESVASISLNRVSRYCDYLGTDIKFDEVDSSNLFEFNFNLERNTNFIETETLERV